MSEKKNKRGNSSKREKNSIYRAKSLENVFSFSRANSKLWESRLDIAEKSRKEYKLSAHRLAAENEDIKTLMIRNESDTVDVITFLKGKLSGQEKALADEREKVRVIKKTSRLEKEKLVEDFTKQVNLLEEKLTQKNHDVLILKDELKFAKEFRRNRREMLSEISELKQTIEQSNKIYKSEFSELEKKFIKEKFQLEKESGSRLEELTEKTHKEAIRNLDETTKSVFKDNIRLKEALNLTIKENDAMKKSKDVLTTQNTKLKTENEINDLTLKTKISQTKQKQHKLTSYKDKVETLEKSLTHAVREFDAEKSKMASNSKTETLSIKEELDKLQRVVELKTREMMKIKKLSKAILDQRTEVECFFMEALDHVKSEMAKDKSTIRQSRGTVSMSSLEETETLNNLRRVKGRLDICDLTWLQKEKVLRLLFAKMNGYSRYTKVTIPFVPTAQRLPLVTQSNVEGDELNGNKTFITQTSLP